MNSKKTRAVALMLLSSCAFSCMQVFVKLTADSVETFEQAFFRNLVSLFVALLMVKKAGTHPLREMRGKPALWGRSFFGFSGIVLFFYAAANAPQTSVAMLNRASPVFVTLLAGVFLKEKITGVKVASVSLCLLGAYIAMNPSFENSEFVPLLCALLAAVAAGVAYTLLAYCKGSVSPSVIILHFSAFSTAAAGILMFPSFKVPSPGTLALLLLIGLFAAAGQIFLTYAYQMAPASEVSIYQYSGVVFTALLSFGIFGETLEGRSILGGIIIFGAIFWVFRYHRVQGGGAGKS
ncbi:MAG: DMT family transporter [Oscillibacter sp.]|nr:DMT family transporter [Oscillibacter sp.]MEA4993019.1 DMT family transporter [Oscillibacter sp.]